jgi:hypothetical protein
VVNITMQHSTPETDLRKAAARDYHYVINAGAEPDLLDHLHAVKRRWKAEHPDHDWNYRQGSISGCSLLCDSFAALLEDADAFSVMQAELGDHWPSIAAREIINFAEKLSSNNRRPTA